MPGPYDAANLEVGALGLNKPNEIELATIIAEETECERELEREHRADQLSELPEDARRDAGLISYVDRLGWEVLLTFRDCVVRCADRAGVTPVEVLQFALNKCHPWEPWSLFWYFRFLASVEEQGGDSRAAAAEAELAYRKMREGGQRGGRKSAETRQKNARIPADAAFVAARRQLLEAGMPESQIATVLAKRWNVTPGAVRKKQAALKRR